MPEGKRSQAIAPFVVGSYADVVRISQEALCDPRTVHKYLMNPEDVRPLVGARIQMAIQRLEAEQGRR